MRVPSFTKLFVSALFFIYGALLAWTDYFLRSWGTASVGQSDIQARGPVLWAVYVPFALGIAAILFMPVSYLSLPKSMRSLLRVAGAAAGAVTAVSVAFVVSGGQAVPVWSFPWVAVAGGTLALVGVFICIRMRLPTT